MTTTTNTTQDEIIYLGVFDDAKGRTLEDKLRNASELYYTRFGRKPSLALISDLEEGVPVSIEGLSVQPKSYIRPHNYWIGRVGAWGVVIEGVAQDIGLEVGA